jgi:glycosyltransferase involved in cell wall biosynthesis
MKIDIVLASYDGENFVGDFIDSLFKQTHENWRLIVSDDGSHDKTTDIINYYGFLDDRIQLVNWFKQGGVIENFNKVLSFVDADYIMFADQDDVWLPDKLEKTIRRIREAESTEGEDVPLLLFTDLTLVDDELNVIAPSFYEYRNLNPLNNTCFRYLFWCSTLFGCTTLFNRALLTLVGDIDDRVIMHDQFFALIASLFGKVVFLNESTILYRQHKSNVVGGLNKTLADKFLGFLRYLDRIYHYYLKILSQTFFLKQHMTRRKINSESIQLCDLLVSPQLLDRLKFWRLCVRPFLVERFALNMVLSFMIIFFQPCQAFKIIDVNESESQA